MAHDTCDSPHPSRRILMVDDNPDAVDILGLLLKRKGHEVHIAYDGPTALVAAQEYLPEVVLLDIGLPGMDGYEVAAELRKLPDLHEVCLIAITGHGDEEDYRRAEEAGFQQHLLKPVHLADIEKALHACTAASKS